MSSEIREMYQSVTISFRHIVEAHEEFRRDCLAQLRKLLSEFAQLHDSSNTEHCLILRDTELLCTSIASTADCFKEMLEMLHSVEHILEPEFEDCGEEDGQFVVRQREFEFLEEDNAPYADDGSAEQFFETCQQLVDFSSQISNLTMQMVMAKPCSASNFFQATRHNASNRERLLDVTLPLWMKLNQENPTYTKLKAKWSEK